MISISVKRLDRTLPLPSYAVDGDGGMDLLAAHDVTLAPRGGRAVVRTGIAVAIPRGFGGFVLPRSGLAVKHGVTVVNSPGLIDSGYRGEIGVPMLNTNSQDEFHVSRGDRVAQLVVMPVEHVLWDEVDDLDDTERGDGGFGHTGLHADDEARRDDPADAPADEQWERWAREEEARSLATTQHMSLVFDVAESMAGLKIEPNERASRHSQGSNSRWTDDARVLRGGKQ